jgi:hypothetical protein
VAEYRVLAADLLKGTILEELPATDLKYAVAVNGWGAWSCTVDLSRRGAAMARALGGATIPARTAIYFDRGPGTIICGGPIWGRKYATSGNKLSLDGAEMLSYLDHIYVTDDKVYAGIDQLAIARSLVDYAMRKPGANIGILPANATQSSGKLRDRTYLRHEGKTVWARLLELSQVDDGFDVRADVAYDGSAVRRRLILGYPSLGRPIALSGLVFEVDAQTLGLDLAEDGGATVNVAYAVGSLPDGSLSTDLPPMVNVLDPTYAAYGWPRLEAVSTYSDVSSLTTLTDYAKAQIATLRLPGTTGALKALGTLDDPALGGYLPGDEARVRVFGDPRWPDGLDLTGRITSISVDVKPGGGEEIGVGLTLPTLLAGVGGGS